LAEELRYQLRAEGTLRVRNARGGGLADILLVQGDKEHHKKAEEREKEAGMIEDRQKKKTKRAKGREEPNPILTRIDCCVNFLGEGKKGSKLKKKVNQGKGEDDVVPARWKSWGGLHPK